MQPSSLPNIENAILSVAQSLQAVNQNTMTHPYKFRARRNAAMNTTAGAFAKITFDLEDYDINNNFTSGTYTAPVSGYYHVTARASYGTNPGQALLAIYKNGAIYQRGAHLRELTGVSGPVISDIIYLSQNDTVEIYVFADNAVAFETSAGSQAQFSMHLLSRDGAISLAAVTNPNAIAYNFSVYRNSAWTTGAGAFAKVAFNTKVYDTGSNFDATTNNRFTAPVTGYYSFQTGISTTANATRHAVALYKNGVEVKRLQDSGVIGTATLTVRGEAVLRLNAGDYIEVFHFTTAGVAGGATDILTWFSGYFLST